MMGKAAPVRREIPRAAAIYLESKQTIAGAIVRIGKSPAAANYTARPLWYSLRQRCKIACGGARYLIFV